MTPFHDDPLIIIYELYTYTYSPTRIDLYISLSFPTEAYVTDGAGKQGDAEIVSNDGEHINNG